MRLSKSTTILALLLISGCATTIEHTPPTVYKDVLVPVPQACISDVEPAPAWATQKITDDSAPEEKAAAVVNELRQRVLYDDYLQKLIGNCINAAK